ncbi:MAG: DUF2569 family protein [Mobilitalea sp.]
MKKLKENEMILTGVYGFLQFFYVTAIIFNPLVWILNIFISLEESYFGSSIITIVIIPIFFTIYSIYIGIQIKKIKNNAIKKTKLFLYILLVYNTLLFIMNVSYFEAEPISIIQSLFGSIGYSCIWLLYFSKSIRVKNTFKNAIE